MERLKIKTQATN